MKNHLHVTFLLVEPNPIIGSPNHQRTSDERVDLFHIRDSSTLYTGKNRIINMEEKNSLFLF